MPRVSIDSFKDVQDLFNLMCEEILKRTPLDVLTEIRTLQKSPIAPVAGAYMDDIIWLIDRCHIDFELAVTYEEGARAKKMGDPQQHFGLKPDTITNAMTKQAREIVNPELREVIPDNVLEIDPPDEPAINVDLGALPEAPKFL